MTNPLSLEWHEGYGPGTNIWFAHRYGYSGNCAAVDLKPGGWQYLIFDRNGTKVNFESARATTPLNARTIAAERLLGWLEREVNQNHDQ